MLVELVEPEADKQLLLIKRRAISCLVETCQGLSPLFQQTIVLAALRECLRALGLIQRRPYLSLDYTGEGENLGILPCAKISFRRRRNCGLQGRIKRQLFLRDNLESQFHAPATFAETLVVAFLLITSCEHSLLLSGGLRQYSATMRRKSST